MKDLQVNISIKRIVYNILITVHDYLIKKREMNDKSLTTIFRGGGGDQY